MYRKTRCGALFQNSSATLPGLWRHRHL